MSIHFPANCVRRCLLFGVVVVALLATTTWSDELPLPGPLTPDGVLRWPADNELRSPLVDDEGRRIESTEQWQQQRKYFQQLIQQIEYGHLPPRPSSCTVIQRQTRPLTNLASHSPGGGPGLDLDASTAPALGVCEAMTLRFGSAPSVDMQVEFYRPAAGGLHRVIVRDENRLAQHEYVTYFLRRGYAVALYARTELDPDSIDVVGPAQAAYPDYDWATIAVWAWGAMRVVDYLETRADVNMNQIAVTGHSRGGKAALLAGALDDRFSLVAPNGSGCGGAGSFRHCGPKAESLELITRPDRFAYWFHPRLRWFADAESKLPFDQQHVKALVAPRALICLESRDDLWANPSGTLATSRAAQDVFDLYGAAQQNAVHVRRGPHDWTAEDWQSLDEFANWRWLDVAPDDPQRYSIVQTIVDGT